MVPLFLLSLLFLLVIGTTPCSTHHDTNINSSALLQFSSLAWDPTAQHFVAGSAMSPTVYAIADEGTVKCLLLELSSNISGDSVSALAVDQIRLRLIVAFSNPSSICAYDLKSYMRIYAVPLLELDGAPSGVMVDLETGEVLVSSVRRGVVLKVGPYGDKLQEFVLSARIKLLNDVSNLTDTLVDNNHTLDKRIISELKSSNDKGLGGIVSLSQGYILVLQTITGKIFKVDTVDGTIKEVLPRESSILLAPSGHTIALKTEKSIVVATNHSVLLIKRDEKSWTRAAIMNKMKMDEGEMIVAVTMQEGEKIFVLVNSLKGYRIEEAVLEECLHRRYVLWCTFLGGMYLLYIILLCLSCQDSKNWELMNWRELICFWNKKR